MQIQKVIERLGFSSKEAKVYLASLSLGESRISDIAEKVKIPRSSAKIIADKLHREGLMNFFVMHRYKYWVAEDPVRLLEKLKERESALQTIIPKLISLRLMNNSKSSVNILRGAEEIKLVHEDIIATKQFIKAVIPWDEWINLLGYDYIKDIREIRTKHYLPLDMLVPKTENSLKIHTKDSKELRHTRFLPSSIQIDTAIFLYGSKTALISLHKESTGIVIDDAGIKNTMSVFFEEIWNKSSSN
jgi:sugar-specific transcriptional regulator TrmB